MAWFKKFRFQRPDGDGTDGGGGTAAPTEAEIDQHFDEADLDAGDDDVTQSEGPGERSTEQAALSKGWTPKDKFKGDPAKWVDAKTFVERGERFASNLKNENQALKRQLEEFKGTAAAFRKYHDEVVAGKQKEIDEAIRGIKRTVKEAEGDRDYDTAEAGEARIKLLEEQKVKLQQEAAAVQQTAPAGINPELQTWIDNGNEWFNTDLKLRAYSIVIGEEIRRAQPQIDGPTFLAQVRERMEEDFPAKFGAMPARRSMADAGGGRRATSPGGGGKSIRDLPKADRDLCRQFVKEGWVTEESFVKSYFERNN